MKIRKPLLSLLSLCLIFSLAGCSFTSRSEHPLDDGSYAKIEKVESSPVESSTEENSKESSDEHSKTESSADESSSEDDSINDHAAVYARAYQPIIDAFFEAAKAMAAGEDPADLSSYAVFETEECVGPYDLLRDDGNLNITACIVDMNGDGIPELLLTQTEGILADTVYAMFTLDESLNPVHVFCSWWRNRYQMTEDGRLYHTASSGAADSLLAICSFNGIDLIEDQLLEVYSYRYDKETGMFTNYEEPQYRYLSEGEDRNITQEEFFSLQESFLNNVSIISVIDYHGF